VQHLSMLSEHRAKLLRYRTHAPPSAAPTAASSAAFFFDCNSRASSRFAHPLSLPRAHLRRSPTAQDPGDACVVPPASTIQYRGRATGGGHFACSGCPSSTVFSIIR
jgi:hypothetical protein